MAEIRPYNENYFAHRRRFISVLSLAFLAIAVAGLAIWYFHSKGGRQDDYVGKVVQISGSIKDIGLVKIFREGKSISYYSSSSGFRDLVYHRFQGDVAIKILARDVAAYLDKKKREFEAAAARRTAETNAEAPSELPPPVDIISGDDRTVEDTPDMNESPAGMEMPASVLKETSRGDENPVPGYARTREAGVREYDREVNELAYKADEIDSQWNKYCDFCQGTIAVTVGNAFGREWFGIYTTINAADTPECKMMIRDMQTLAADIDSGMEAAWEKAHRAGVYPGQIRAVQQKYRMELDRWNK